MTYGPQRMHARPRSMEVSDAIGMVHDNLPLPLVFSCCLWRSNSQFGGNENATGGRLIVIAVDQPNIRFGANQAISRAAAAFLDRLSPSDRVAITGFGLGAPVTPFSGDRERAKLRQRSAQDAPRRRGGGRIRGRTGGMTSRASIFGRSSRTAVQLLCHVKWMPTTGCW